MKNDSKNSIKNFYNLNFELSDIGSIEGWNYYNRNLIELKILPHLDFHERFNFFENYLIKNGEFPYDESFVLNKVNFNFSQIKEIYNLLTSKQNNDEFAVSACYDPRNLILIKDKNRKFLAYIEFCFECNNYKKSDNLKLIQDEDFMKFESFFKKNNLLQTVDDNFLKMENYHTKTL